MAGSSSSELVLQPGTKLAGKYVLEKPAGFGGMAQIWVAKNEATAAEVCVKVMTTAHTDPDSVARFRREANAAARLSHRNIVRVFDLVELDAEGAVSKTKDPHALAMVMELLRGETLGDRLAKKEKLSLEEALDVALPFLAGVAHAHRAGIVHRDLKPDNIFLAMDPDGQMIPKVLDFGISKAVDSTPLTHHGEILGTPSFMSPEQARGARTLDPRSDVFSAATVIYVMLAGKNPFAEESFPSIVTAILEKAPSPIEGVPEEIFAVLEKAFAKDASRRPADAGELAALLAAAAGRPPVSVGRVAVDSSTTIPPVGSSSTLSSKNEVPPAYDPRRRARRIVVAVVAAAVVLLAIAAVRTMASDPSEPSAQRPGHAAPAESPSGAAPPVTETVEPPVEKSIAPSAASASTPARHDGGRHAAPSAAPPGSGPRKPPARRPGEEPKKAREPGF